MDMKTTLAPIAGALLGGIVGFFLPIFLGSVLFWLGLFTAELGFDLFGWLGLGELSVFTFLLPYQAYFVVICSVVGAVGLYWLVSTEKEREHL